MTKGSPTRRRNHRRNPSNVAADTIQEYKKKLRGYTEEDDQASPYPATTPPSPTLETRHNSYQRTTRILSAEQRRKRRSSSARRRLFDDEIDLDGDIDVDDDAGTARSPTPSASLSPTNRRNLSQLQTDRPLHDHDKIVEKCQFYQFDFFNDRPINCDNADGSDDIIIDEEKRENRFEWTRINNDSN